MKRTPTRKSPRFPEPSAIGDAECSAVATVVELMENPAASPLEVPTVSCFTTTTECLSAAPKDSIANITETAPTIPAHASIAATAPQENLLREMRRRIIALEEQLKATQAKIIPTPLSPISSVTVALPPTERYECTPPLSSQVSPSPLAPMPLTSMPLAPSMPSASMPSYSMPFVDQRSAANVNVVYSHAQPTMQFPSANSLLSQAAPRKIQDLPEFSGRAEDWPMFATAYAESTAAYGYTNLENSQRLQKCLKGEARDTVQSLLIHPNNVNAVIEQLRSRFGRPEQLIRSQLRVVKEIPTITETSMEKLIPFSTKVNNLSIFLQSVNGQHHLANPTLLDELIDKLPMSKRIDWATFAAPIQPYPTIIDFSHWLNKLASIICTLKNTTVEPKQRRVVLHATEDNISGCPICRARHKIVDCKRFGEDSVKDRWAEAKRLKLCFTCLLPGHSTRMCRHRKLCDVEGCRRSHHKLLHEVRTASDRSLMSPRDVEGSVLSCLARPNWNSKLLFRILPVRVFGPRKRADVYALFDEGSSVTMVDRDLTDELGLNGHRSELNIQWFGGRRAQEDTTMVRLEICGVAEKKRYVLNNVHAVANLKLPVQTLNESELAGSRNDLKYLPIKAYSGVKPKVLIGLDHCHLGLPSETVQLKESGPYAAKTKLGWVVFGPTKGTKSTVDPNDACLLIEDDTHKLIADYFDIESFGVRPSPMPDSDEDIRARGILQSSTIKVGGRFQTGLLWKSDTIELPDNYALAEKRLLGLERKMRRDSTFAAAYEEIIKGYVAKGYARKLQPEEARAVRPRTWYLPHFASVNPNKPGKMRLVFDAAAKFKGVSLNSYLLKGPQQYQSMPSVLFNFRVGRIALCGDIREMFHQVLVRPVDRSAQRFLWRSGDSRRPPDVYEMLVMTFGAACSPCAAEYVKTVNALEYLEQDPRAVECITQHHYVDDLVDSFESEEQAIAVAERVREIHQGAGFEMRGFTSNSPRVTSALAGKSTCSEGVNEGTEKTLSTEKILGMYWEPSSDNFKYILKFNRLDPETVAGTKRLSKRQLLSVVMSVFDPLGFLCHFLVGAKLIMREVWRLDIGWDEPLPDNINIAWRKWHQRINEVVKIRIPRHYPLVALPREVQLHVFVDASEEVFAAVAYWRVVSANGSLAAAFVCAKTKCSPLKPVTIPRLELQAAVLGTRLMQTIIAEHPFKINRRILWSDSKTVIKWIESKNRRYKPFVAHRIAEILAATKPQDWRWIPTEENVADEATRMKYDVDFGKSSRWFQGPPFLRRDEGTWPDVSDEGESHEDSEVLPPKFALLAVRSEFLDFSRFSSLTRLKRTTAWILRFANRCRRIIHPQEDKGLTVAELDAAESLLCRRGQSESYAYELSLLESGRSLTKESSLYKLMPYKDAKGILRVYGRIDAASWLSMLAGWLSCTTTAE